MVTKKPVRWSASDDALRAVQVAFDVEQVVLDAVRTAAFQNNLSTSDQIRQVLKLTTTARPKRPRLTVSLKGNDYEVLGARYGVDSQDRLVIKEKVTDELIRFAKLVQSDLSSKAGKVEKPQKANKPKN